MDKILIKNEKLAEVLNTDDAVYAFSRAAENGQVRLAMDILADILPTIIKMNSSNPQKIKQHISERVQDSDTADDSSVKPSKKVTAVKTED